MLIEGLQMKGMAGLNQRLFYQRFAIGLVIGLVVILWPELAIANGGTTLLVEKVGAYEVTITASPYPLEVGLNDISVLVGRLSDQQIVLDAEVLMVAEPVDHSGQPQSFSATHTNATNKLYYAANVVFPTPGRWKMTVQVDGPEGSASTVFETQVEEQSSDFLRYFSLIGLPLIAIVILFFVLNRRAGSKLNSYLEGEENEFGD